MGATDLPTLSDNEHDGRLVVSQKVITFAKNSSRL